MSGNLHQFKEWYSVPWMYLKKERLLSGSRETAMHEVINYLP